MARQQNRQGGRQGGGGGQRDLKLTINLDGTGADTDKIEHLKPYGFCPLEVPAHAGVGLLNFLSRFEKWTWNRNQNEYQLKALTYRVDDVLENLFLAFYRLLPREPESDAYSEHKAQYLKALEARWKNSSVWSELAERVYERQRRLLEALDADGWATWRKELVTAARLIAGLGYKGALEVGLTLHPLYGFPYLPGTAVKGIARAYAELVEKADEKLIRRIFGSPKKDEKRAKEFRVGCVRFFDALPTSFPKLDVEVMTPHFTKYYMEYHMDGEAPGDWHSPVPVPFLAVAEGQPFSFFLAARGDVETSEDAITEAEAAAYLDRAARCLKQGLAALGAGGKTAAGYGYFLTKSDREAEQEKLAQLAKSLREEEKKAAFTPPNILTSIGKSSTKVPAQVVGYRGSVLLVRLHVAGYEQQPFELGKFAGFQKDEWVEVNAAGTNKKGRVTQVQYAGRLSRSR